MHELIQKVRHLIQRTRTALPLLDKYLVVWDVLGDISKAENRGAGLFFQDKYTIRRCAQFSIECLAVVAVLFVILRWLATRLERDSTLDFIDQLAPIWGQGPLTAEFYVLGYLVAALVLGFLLDQFLTLASRRWDRDSLVLTRFLLMYPGIFLWVCLTSLLVLMVCNWASMQTGISIPTWTPSEIGWPKFLLGFFLVVPAVLAAASLAGAFFGWPILVLRITHSNYGSIGVVGLLLIPAAFFVFMGLVSSLDSYLRA